MPNFAGPASRKVVRVNFRGKAKEQDPGETQQTTAKTKRIRTVVLWSTCWLIVGLFLLSALVPFLPAEQQWPVSMMGLVFPWLFLATTMILVILLIGRSKWSIAVTLALLCSWKATTATFGFRFYPASLPETVAADNIRLLSWNVYRWDEMRQRQPGVLSNRVAMINAILGYHADVLCFHEFFEPRGKALKKFESNVEAFRAAGYPYHTFFATSAIHDSTKRFGMAIFSRYPIVDSANVSFGKTAHSEGLMYADVEIRKQKIRVFSTHLESFRLGKSNYLGKGGDGLINDTKKSLSVIRGAYSTREAQTALVKKYINESPYPVVFCANLGDVPNSETYAELSKDLKDGFLEKDNGFGKTFKSVIPNLRLDYIMVDKRINVENFYISPVGYSDHFPLVSDIHITENQDKN